MKTQVYWMKLSGPRVPDKHVNGHKVLMGKNLVIRLTDSPAQCLFLYNRN